MLTPNQLVLLVFTSMIILSVCQNHTDLYASGRNINAQLFFGHARETIIPSIVPVKWTGDVQEIVAGYSHSMMLTTTGEVYTVGQNLEGQIGNGLSAFVAAPFKVNTSSWTGTPVQIAAGYEHNLVRTSAGKVYGWGSGAWGALGTGLPVSDPVRNPVLNSFVGTFTDLASGGQRGLGLASSGLLYAWGMNGDGQCGLGFTFNFNGPTLVDFAWNGTITQISAGSVHTLVIATNGTDKKLYVFGGNQFGQLGLGDLIAKRTPILNDFMFSGSLASVYAGTDRSFFITNTGNLYATGWNTQNALGLTGADRLIPELIDTSSWSGTPSKVVTGPTHSVFLTTSGAGYSVGGNANGQLGLGDTISRSIPTKFTNSTTNIYATADVAVNFMLVKCPTGKYGANCGETVCFNLYPFDPTVCSSRGNCTGVDMCTCPSNTYGQDCSGNKCFGVQANETTVCSGKGKCTALDVCTCEIGRMGSNCESLLDKPTLYAVGSNQIGELGIGTTTNLNYPTQVRSNVSSIVSGQNHVIAQAQDGNMFSWGVTSDGRPGHGNIIPPIYLPTPIPFVWNSAVVSFCAGTTISIVATANGNVYSFGSDSDGLLGLGTDFGPHYIPKLVPFAWESNVVEVSCFRTFVAGRTKNGQVYTWGMNTVGQLATGDTISKNQPHLITATSATSIIKIATGSQHMLMINSTRAVFSNGLGSSGQLGHNISSNELVPRVVTADWNGLPDEIAAGQTHSLVLTTNGAVYVFGSNVFGELGRGAPLQNTFAPFLLIFPWVGTPGRVSAGISHTQILTKNGSLYHFGLGTSGQLGFSNTLNQNSPVLLASNVYMIMKPGANARSFFGVCPIGYAMDTTGTSCAPICYTLGASDATVCGGHGVCSGIDTCTCNSGWIGTQCSILTCNMIHPTNTSFVCNGGKGNCTGPNECVNCETGWSGNDCQHAICYGKQANSSFVCNNQRGICTSPDKCDCLPGWIGNECQNAICFGILSNQTTVCNGTKRCTAPDTCTDCPNGYTGFDCQTITCSGLTPTNPLVCSSRGTCVGPNTCNCQAGWTGSNCETPLCFGIAASNSSVCTARGNCTFVNTCSCIGSFLGDRCQFLNCGGLNLTDAAVCPPPPSTTDLNLLYLLFLLLLVPIAGIILLFVIIIVIISVAILVASRRAKGPITRTEQLQDLGI